MNARTADSHVSVPDITAAATTTALPALLTIACGLIVIFCVGFLQTPVAHNATHDTRHANGFPCH